LAASLWWNILALHIVLMVMFITIKSTLVRWQFVFHLFGWGIPAVVVVIAFSASKVGTTGLAAFCLLNAGADGAWEYGLFCI
jgi:hypothetical protein